MNLLENKAAKGQWRCGISTERLDYIERKFKSKIVTDRTRRKSNNRIV